MISGKGNYLPFPDLEKKLTATRFLKIARKTHEYDVRMIFLASDVKIIMLLHV